MLNIIQGYLIFMIILDIVFIIKSREFGKLILWKKIALLVVSPLLLIREILNEIATSRKRY